VVEPPSPLLKIPNPFPFPGWEIKKRGEKKMEGLKEEKEIRNFWPLNQPLNKRFKFERKKGKAQPEFLIKVIWGSKPFKPEPLTNSAFNQPIPKPPYSKPQGLKFLLPL